MKTSKIIAAATLSLLAAVGTQAETYDGVLTVNSVASRAEVTAQARDAARAGNLFSEASFSGVTPALTASVDRATVQSQAVEIASQSNVYGEVASAGVLSTRGGYVDRGAVRAQAVEAARNPSL